MTHIETNRPGVGVLRAEEVSFSYAPKRELIRQVTLAVHPGEVVILLGANGSGKSTLLRLLSGHLRPTHGRVLVGGEEITRLSLRAVARQLAIVFQEQPTAFSYPVEDVVAMGRAPYLGALERPGDSEREIALRALEKVGRADLAGRVFNELSGGERQLVLIAQALAQDTPVMLLDEPTAALDFRHSAEIVRLVHQMAARENKAVVMVTHAPDQALYMPCTVGLIEEGQIFAWGKSETVLTSSALSRTYGTAIKVLTATDDEGRAYRTCRAV